MGQTYQSIVINTPVEEVWAAIRDFHDLSWAPNVISQVDVVGHEKGDQAGAGRVLNNAFRETLREFNDDARSFAYSIDDGPPPVSVEGGREKLPWPRVSSPGDRRGRHVRGVVVCMGPQ